MSKASNTKREVRRRRRVAMVVGAVALVLTAIVLAGCASTTGGEQNANRGSASPAPRPETAQPTTLPSPTKPPPGLPPERKGFTPEPEQYAVMGDPHAPVTIVEYSDYQ
ncbi:MAG: hypothetical protein GXP41_01410 [Chloroflexi bacterium]|nr:hypothetical protein [Chloroflexota bacterium]